MENSPPIGWIDAAVRTFFGDSRFGEFIPDRRAKIGEIIGGSQREERLDVLDRNMAERGIDREHYAWYRDLRRYGTVPHAGFERTLAYVTGLSNVRDAIPFPRTPGNARY